ncbi:hypothetical protein [Soonwooa sp.]|uniref:hypothetical protein n=1 Tax=Soonwooa sp. TaxID=1938592 RepID=UPI00262442D5|nr:hypothetical protein [Soonwooa sp.]
MIKKILVYAIMFFTLQCCQGQEAETFWRSKSISKVDNSEISAFSNAFTNEVLATNIHLSKNGDALQLDFPESKKIKISDLKSLSNVKLENGVLLDSIYDIDVKDKLLNIKFYFNGREKKDRYILSFQTMDKASYSKEVAELQASQKKLIESLKSLEISKLDLQTKWPSYFDKSVNIDALNYHQTAELLASRIAGLQSASMKNEVSVDAFPIFKYREVSIKNSNKLNFAAVKFAGAEFNNLKYISDAETEKPEAIVFSDSHLTSKQIADVFNKLNSQFGKPEIVPTDYSSFLAFTWKDANNIVKMVLTEDDLDADEIPALDAEKLKKNSDAAFLLKEYSTQLKKPNVTVTLVSNKLSAIMKGNLKNGAKPNVEYNY